MLGGLKYIFLLSVLFPPVDGIMISELMYDPMGNDQDNEWIELFNNNDSIDLSGLRLEENSINHLITVYQGSKIMNRGEYAIIAQDIEKFLMTYPDYKGALFHSSFSLSNTQDAISLVDLKINKTYDHINYHTILGASDNGFTLSRYEDTFQESIPTPGNKNTIKDICDWKISINSDSISQNKEEFEFRVIIEKNIGNEANLTISRTIEDAYGDTAKIYDLINKNYARDSYKETLRLSPNLQEGKAYLIKAKIENISCDDSNDDNDYDEELVYIKNKLGPESSIEVENVLDLGSDKEAEFGQIIRVDLNIYKGNTTKDSIKVYAKNNKGKISKESKTGVYDKFTPYHVTVPLQLISNCNQKFDDGEYTVVAEGLEVKDNLDFDVRGINKENCASEMKTDNKQKSSTIEIIDSPETATNGEDLNLKIKVYNGDSEKHSYKIYSYVYRGPKVYSGDKMGNLMEVSIGPIKEETIMLINRLDDLREGDYKIKAVLQQDNQKTQKESVKDLNVISSNSFEDIDIIPTLNEDILTLDLMAKDNKIMTEKLDLSEYLIEKGKNQNNNQGNAPNPKIVYQSNNENIKKLVPLLIIFVLVISNILFILRD